MGTSVRTAIVGVALAFSATSMVAQADLSYGRERLYEGLSELHRAHALLVAAPSGSSGEAARQYVERAIDAFHTSCLLMDSGTSARYDSEPAVATGDAPEVAAAQALEFLNRARLDISAGGFDPFTAGAEHRTIKQINLAAGALVASHHGA